MNSRPVKIIWICHFNNRKIADSFGIKDYKEFAPWISRFADIFSTHGDLEIHILSPHDDIQRLRRISDPPVYMYFFPFRSSLLPNRVSNYLNSISGYSIIKRRIWRLVTDIKPDLIHMFGTENAYYSSSVFQFLPKYPVLVTIQGFAYKISISNYQVRIRKRIEEKILKTLPNFGVRDEEMRDYISRLNPGARFYTHDIAPYQPQYVSDKRSEKDYDIVFFSRVCKDKGIEDLICSLEIVKKHIPGIKLCVIGQAPEKYYRFLENMAGNLDLADNVNFLGEIPSIDEVHKVAITSKISVLPTKYDTIPGTIIESMFMGIPCISYPVGGIPSLNADEETIKLVEKDNIPQLADAIVSLLSDQELRDGIALRAQKYARKRWNEKKLYNDLRNAYMQISI